MIIVEVFTQFKFRRLQSKTIVRVKTLQQKSFSQLIKYMSKLKVVQVMSSNCVKNELKFKSVMLKYFKLQKIAGFS